MKLNRKHILLLLLYSPGKSNEINEPIDGRTRIIKAMFLFKEEIQKNFLKDSNIELVSLPNFYAWDYGPFSKDVYDDIEFFINNGFIKNTIIDESANEAELDEYENWAIDYLLEDENEIQNTVYNEERFRLSQKGIDFIINKVYKNLTDNQKSILIQFKKQINKASLDAIIRYTYLKYPEYTHLSKIKDKIFG